MFYPTAFETVYNIVLTDSIRGLYNI